ncbi:hypothetical protein SLE2022_126830 [Rubroshorea leprosula]
MSSCNRPGEAGVHLRLSGPTQKLKTTKIPNSSNGGFLEAGAEWPAAPAVSTEEARVRLRIAGRGSLSKSIMTNMDLTFLYIKSKNSVWR